MTDLPSSVDRSKTIEWILLSDYEIFDPIPPGPVINDNRCGLCGRYKRVGQRCSQEIYSSYHGIWEHR